MISAISYKLNDTEISLENPLPAYLNYTVTYSDDVAFPFGYGLSYTTFEYSGVNVEPELSRGGKIKASVTIKNTGSRRGTEVVQMYIYDHFASVARPSRELKGFKKLTLDAGEERVVEFEIDEEMLKYWNIDMKFEADAGKFTVYIGHDSKTDNSAEFELV